MTDFSPEAEVIFLLNQVPELAFVSTQPRPGETYPWCRVTLVSSEYHEHMQGMDNTRLTAVVQVDVYDVDQLTASQIAHAIPLRLSQIMRTTPLPSKAIILSMAPQSGVRYIPPGEVSGPHGYTVDLRFHFRLTREN